MGVGVGEYCEFQCGNVCFHRFGVGRTNLGTRENKLLEPALQVLKAGSFCLNVRLLNTLTLFVLG